MWKLLKFISCGYIFIKCSNKEILWEKDDGEFLQKKRRKCFFYYRNIAIIVGFNVVILLTDFWNIIFYNINSDIVIS